MRQLHCDDCIKRPVFGNKPLHEGTYELLAADALTGEPAEWVRVIHGSARPPTLETRVMFINGQRVPMPLDAYECDNCNAAIKAGDSAWCVTMWQPARQQEPPRWEDAYVAAMESATPADAVAGPTE